MSLYSEETAEKICDGLLDGKSFVQICSQSGMPSRATVMRWLHDRPDFETKCARARMLQADLMDDKILEEAEKCNSENFQAARVKISAYQWRASKLAPKKYGDKIVQEHTGEVGIKSILVPERISTERSATDVKPDFGE